MKLNKNLNKHCTFKHQYKTSSTTGDFKFYNLKSCVKINEKDLNNLFF